MMPRLPVLSICFLTPVALPYSALSLPAPLAATGCWLLLFAGGWLPAAGMLAAGGWLLAVRCCSKLQTVELAG